MRKLFVCLLMLVGVASAQNIVKGIEVLNTEATVQSPFTVSGKTVNSSTIRYITVYLDGKKVFGNSNSTTYNTTLTASVGRHRITVQATDNAGFTVKNTYYVNVVSNTAGGHSVDLNWKPSTTTSIAGYNVYRSTTSGCCYSKINPQPVTSTLFTDQNVVSAKTYYYVARAVTSTGIESANSNQAKAVIP